MKALCWMGTKDVRVRDVPDPDLEGPRDAVIRVTKTAICGSDLHLYHGIVPEMEEGDVLGHEFMGVVEEVGTGVPNLARGDRVVVPFTIACGSCFFCDKKLFSCCDNSNPTAETAEKLNGQSTSGMFGYSHIYGGFSGGQAEYVRVPFADVGPFKVPDGLDDEQVLFLTDILPTAWMAAKNADIADGDTVAVWGCGPVGQLAVRCAYALGAGRVIAIDRHPGRLAVARDKGKAETVDADDADLVERLKGMTAGRGPDSCIDCVGMEAHGGGVLAAFESVKQSIGITKDVPVVLRQAIMACRKGGTISIPGVYAAFVNHLPLGAAFAKGLTFRMGQTHVHRFLPELTDMISSGRIDPTFIITHRMPIDDAARGYELFDGSPDECLKVVLHA